MDRTRKPKIEPEVPFGQMVSDLSDMGYTYSDLMHILGAGYDTFANLKTGRVKDPRWQTGQQLRRFWKEKMAELASDGQ